MCSICDSEWTCSRCGFINTGEDSCDNCGDSAPPCDTEMARDYLAKKFKPEYSNYIENTLAGDFAVALADEFDWK